MVSTQRKTAFPDATTLIALSTEMASSMNALIESVPQFVAAPAVTPISSKVRRVGNTARILSLRAIGLVADETAELAQRIESGQVQNTEPAQEILRSALAAIQRYIKNAAACKVSAGLVMYSAYSDVMALLPERKALNRSELFLPVYPVYGNNSHTYSEAKFVAEISRYHDEFHQALMKFCANRSIDNVNAMRTALVTMETKIPPANYRTFFSLAISFLDVAIRNGGRIPTADEQLLTRIDQQLASVVKNEMEIDEGTVSWFLQTLATVQQFSARIRTFQDTYDLPRLAEDDVSSVISEQTIANAQMALQNAQRTWESAMMAGGDVNTAKSASFALLAVCNIIGDYALKTMSMAVGSLADGVATNVVPMNHDTAVFGASILLAIADRIASIAQNPKGGRAMADFHRDRVRGVLAGKSTSDKSVAAPSDGSHSQAILDEVVNNVSATEQIVDQCLRDGIKEVKAKEALKLFSMVRNALLLLNMEDGAKLAEKVESHLRDRLGKMLDGAPADDAGNIRMAEGVMLMGRYIKLVLVDPPQASATLIKAMALFATETTAEEGDSAEIPSTVLADDLPFDVCADEELGPIFFEEAKDVIGNNILPGLAKMRVNPSDEQALVDVRRGFHTIKGSARMVELNNLGLLGQHAEYTLNVCLENPSIKPNQAMIEWLQTIAQQFNEAIVQLEAGHRTPVDNITSKLIHDRFMETNVFTLDLPQAVTRADEDFHIDVGNVMSAEELGQGPDVHIHETGEVVMPLKHVDPVEPVEVIEVIEPVDPVEAAATLQQEIDAVQSPDLDLFMEEMPQLHGPVVAQIEPMEKPVPEALDAQEIPPVPASEFAAPALSESDAETISDSIPPVPVSILIFPEPTALSLIEPYMPRIEESVAIDTEVYGGPGTSQDVKIDEPIEASQTFQVAESATASVCESGREIQVGNISIPGVLYNAFVIEARPFYNSLEALILELISGKREVMDFEVLRLAHSLAGMGRTTGLMAITEIACELEAWASIMRDHKVNVTDDQETVLRDTLEALDAMILGIEDCLEPISDANVVQAMKKMVSDAEHHMAHGRTNAEMEDSLLQRMEDGGEVTDSGVAESIVFKPEAADVVLDSISDSIFTLSEFTKTEALSSDFATTVQVDLPVQQTEVTVVEAVKPIYDLTAEDDDNFHVIGDTVEAGQGDGAILDAVDTEIAASTFQEVDVINLDDAFSTEPAAPVTLAPEQLTIELINPLPGDEKPGAVFVAPSAITIDAAPIRESEAAVPSSIQVDIGTTTTAVLQSLAPEVGKITSLGAGAQAETNAQNNAWLQMVKDKADEIDDEMLPIFLEEAEQSFVDIDAALTALSSDVGNKRMFQSLKRSMHTLKGSSNTAGARKVGALFHYLEDVMTESPSMTEGLVVTVQGGVDAAFAGIEAMRKGRSVESAIERAGRAAMRHQAIGSEGDLVVEENPESSVESASESNTPSTQSNGSATDSTSSVNTSSASVIAVKSDSILPSATGVERKEKRAGLSRKQGRSKEEEDTSTLRVATKTLDRMVKTVGEVGISRSRMAANLDLSKTSMMGLAVSLERMNSYLRAIELEAEKQMFAGTEGSKDKKFDALQMDRFTRLQELTRRVAEAQNDVLTQQTATLGAIREMEEVIANQNVLVTDITGDLDEIRQVRVASIVPALKRVVRAACRDTGKLGEIFFDADVEIDRGILDKMVAPIEHILRNAIAHGIESPNERVSVNKPETGTIEFRAFQDGGEVVIEIHDDGRGIDTQRVMDKAIEKGLITPGDHLSEEKVHNLLFEPGFSTADAVTDIAGRGVGLDVVRSEVSAMGGRVDVNSRTGNGTSFILRMPATLTVIAGAAVRTNAHMYVIPVSFIDRLVRINAKDLDEAYKSHKIFIKDAEGETVEYDFWGMWQLVGSHEMEGRANVRNSVILMRGSRVAVHVDDVRPAAEYVFRPMGPQLESSSGLIGSTINTSGNAALVIDPARVARNIRLAIAQAIAKGQTAELMTKKAVKTPLILIVDDSLTVRKVTTRLLKREGLRHVEAENGMQALERIQEERPDVILMDIEMPVMNGYEATQAIRATPETADIPIIMITSRVGESHKTRAFDLGVNEYLGKPYNDKDLLEMIRKHSTAKAAANA